MSDDELLLTLVMRLWGQEGQLLTWEHLGVGAEGDSRTMAALARLRALGFDVRHSHAGVRIVPFDDTPCTHESLKDLGVPTVCSPVVYSTNTIAAMLARAGAPHGTLVLAESQLEGRGRHGSTWFSPAGVGIWCSMIQRSAARLEHGGLVGLMAGLCVLRALRAMGGDGVVMKWANDVLWRGRKLCGILVERVQGMEGHAYVVGIGVNVHQKEEDFPPEIRGGSVSLDTIMRQRIARTYPLHAIARELLEAWSHEETSGFRGIPDQWNAESGTVGAFVRVSVEGSTIGGTVVGVNEEGALLVKESNGRSHAIYSGHVELVEDRRDGVG